MGTTLDQMDPGIPVEELVWAQSACYFLRTHSTTLCAQEGEEGQ